VKCNHPPSLLHAQTDKTVARQQISNSADQLVNRSASQLVTRSAPIPVDAQFYKYYNVSDVTTLFSICIAAWTTASSLAAIDSLAYRAQTSRCIVRTITRLKNTYTNTYHIHTRSTILILINTVMPM